MAYLQACKILSEFESLPLSNCEGSHESFVKKPLNLYEYRYDLHQKDKSPNRIIYARSSVYLPLFLDLLCRNFYINPCTV